MRLDTLEDLYLKRLKEVRGTAGRLRAVLPDFAAASSDADLAGTLTDSIASVEAGLSALDEIAARHDEPCEDGQADGMAALVAQARRDALDAPFGEAETRDAAIVMHHRQLAQYAATGFASLRAFAERLRLREDAAALRGHETDRARDTAALHFLARGALDPAAAEEG